jgi:hypothetical protein
MVTKYQPRLNFPKVNPVFFGRCIQLSSMVSKYDPLNFRKVNPDFVKRCIQLFGMVSKYDLLNFPYLYPER